MTAPHRSNPDFERHRREEERERATAEMHRNMGNPYSPPMPFGMGMSSMVSNRYDDRPEPNAPQIDMREVDNGHIQIMVTYSTGKKFAKDFFLQRNHHQTGKVGISDFNSSMQSISSSVNKTLLKLFL